MRLRRGDLVVAAVPGPGGGRPRPAVIVQSNDLVSPDTIIVLPLTTGIRGESMFRVVADAEPSDALAAPCEIMIDKPGAVRREHIRRRIGRVTTATRQRLDTALARMVGLSVR